MTDETEMSVDLLAELTTEDFSCYMAVNDNLHTCRLRRTDMAGSPL